MMLMFCVFGLVFFMRWWLIVWLCCRSWVLSVCFFLCWKLIMLEIVFVVLVYKVFCRFVLVVVVLSLIFILFLFSWCRFLLMWWKCWMVWNLWWFFVCWRGCKVCFWNGYGVWCFCLVVIFFFVMRLFMVRLLWICWVVLLWLVLFVGYVSVRVVLFVLSCLWCVFWGLMKWWWVLVFLIFNSMCCVWLNFCVEGRKFFVVCKKYF